MLLVLWNCLTVQQNYIHVEEANILKIDSTSDDNVNVIRINRNPLKIHSV